MLSLRESLRLALENVRAYGLRSALTVSGIAIGVTSVIAVVSIMQGLSYSISQSFDGLGSNSLTIRSYTPLNDQLQGKMNRLTLPDYRELLEHLGDIDDITPSFLPFGPFGTTVRHGRQTAFTRVEAVTSNYQQAFKIFAKTGRSIGASDDKSRRKICVIGDKLREHLKLPDNPLGVFIEIGGESFKAVGVTEKRGEIFGLSQDDYVLIPFSIGETMSPGNSLQDITVSVSVADTTKLDSVQDRATQILRRTHHLKRGEFNDFKVETAQQLKDSFGQLTDIVTYVLSGMVGLSVLVGGIGIMNIMLVSVTERTKEIGICMALGARREDIMIQFLIEAATLSLSGGLIGLGLGFLVGFGVTHVIPNIPQAFVPLWAVLLAIGSSTLIGLIFGVVPAAKAAHLDPIVALRHE